MVGRQELICHGLTLLVYCSLMLLSNIKNTNITTNWEDNYNGIMLCTAACQQASAEAESHLESLTIEKSVFETLNSRFILSAAILVVNTLQ